MRAGSEIVCSTIKKRRWTPVEKHQIIQETYQNGVTVSYVARKHGIQPSQLFLWRKIAENGALTSIKKEEKVVPQSEVDSLKRHIKQLERVLGQKTLENEILKEAVKLGRGKKTHLATTLARIGRFRVRAIARTLNISRSNLIERLNAMKKRTQTYKKREDEQLLPAILAITDQRSSYGYRRVTALLNQELIRQQQPKVNHKRVYRIMKQNDLLLPAYGKRPSRTHDGKIITLKSNLRWCSDCFTIQCANGERVFVAFTLDTCDREILSYLASTVGIDGAAIRDLMLEAVEYRFGVINRLPHKIQWLSDNAPCYVAKDTVEFARALGFEVCTTAPYSPESNGMAEAFVKTFKRDYVAFYDALNAYDFMRQLPQWFHDYNENAPHKGLNMMSPRQFLMAALR
ncbi:IS3 family transposase [Legionella maceachernii]|nr:IS3 family transposase [Legionella maceachernii]